MLKQLFYNDENINEKFKRIIWSVEDDKLTIGIPIVDKVNSDKYDIVSYQVIDIPKECIMKIIEKWINF